jgi:Rps23 Pro-64 3,4-dihydroxylase Tpa1-like proline 4-hydroxylase
VIFTLNDFTNMSNVMDLISEFGKNPHCPYVVLADFFKPGLPQGQFREFPAIGRKLWYGYVYPLEIKRSRENWNLPPELTYSGFLMFKSSPFLIFLSEQLLGGIPLHVDPRLNAGGWHTHAKGGKLNTHLDCSLHPRLGLHGKINIIVNLNPDWRDEWCGALGLWRNKSSENPEQLVKKVSSRFNHSLIFDTTQDSWHGLSKPLECPEGEYRRSLAAYFLCDPSGDVNRRGKALFAPSEDQENDQSPRDLIAERAETTTAAFAYRGQNSSK